jgi:uncharacterized Zn finger protein (UPF0148 family)
MLREMACPKCGAPGLQANQPDGVVMCSFCGNTFAADNSVACPHCETINPPDSGFCKACGEKLKSNCPACGVPNWSGAEYCARCGRNLSAVTALAERHSQGFKGVLKQQRETANALKSGDEESSKKRLGVMWDKEAERQAHLASQRAEQERQQHRLLTVAISLAVVFLVIAVLFIFFLIAR